MTLEIGSPCPYRERVDWDRVVPGRPYKPRYCAFYAGHDSDHRGRDGRPIIAAEYDPLPYAATPATPRTVLTPPHEHARFAPQLHRHHAHADIVHGFLTRGVCFDCPWTGPTRLRTSRAARDAARHVERSAPPPAPLGPPRPARPE